MSCQKTTNNNRQERAKFYLFPKLSSKDDMAKLKMDHVSIYSISSEKDANFITNIIKKYVDTDATVTDATAGVGGNTISFSGTFKHVNAIEIDETRYNYLKNNIELYQKEILNTAKSDKSNKSDKSDNAAKSDKSDKSDSDNDNAQSSNSAQNQQQTSQDWGDNSIKSDNEINHIKDNVTFYWDDCLKLLQELTQDVIFFDPPWGGKEYKKFNKIKLYLSNKCMVEICNTLRKRSKYIVLKVPINFDFTHFEQNTIYQQCEQYKLNKMVIIVIKNE